MESKRDPHGPGWAPSRLPIPSHLPPRLSVCGAGPCTDGAFACACVCVGEAVPCTDVALGSTWNSERSNLTECGFTLLNVCHKGQCASNTAGRQCPIPSHPVVGSTRLRATPQRRMAGSRLPLKARQTPNRGWGVAVWASGCPGKPFSPEQRPQRQLFWANYSNKPTCVGTSGGA